MAEAWEEREEGRTTRIPRAQHQPAIPGAAVVAAVVEQPGETDAAPEEEEEEETEDPADEAEWEKLRAAVDSEGVYVAQDGAEVLSMAEVERRLSSGELDGEEQPEEQEEEEDDDDAHEQEEDGVAEGEEDGDLEDDEQGEWDEEDEAAVDSAQPPRPARRDGRSFPSAQVMWIRQRADGSVSVKPWPLADDGDDASLDSDYALNMPTPRSSDPSAVIGASVGGEAVSLQSVVVLDERDLSEHFTKGGGRGGQKVNKSSNCVHLQHRPTGTVVKCHATRSLADNRRIARDIMQRRLEELVLGPASRNQQRRSKIRKSKAKRSPHSALTARRCCCCRLRRGTHFCLVRSALPL